MQKSQKKILPIITLLMIALISTSLDAQTTTNTTLNVVLNDVRSIKVNPSQTNVSLIFNNADDYTNGVFSNQASHLEITSTGGYIVKVKSSGPNLTNGVNTIPVNTISLTPTVSSSQSANTIGATGSTGAVVVKIVSTTTLSSTDAQFINSPTGSTKIFYDVKYASTGGPNYINKPAGTYTTTITYSIEPL